MLKVSMGERVRMLDLARDVVLLSAFRADVDIPILIMGARPGEKVAETRVREDEAVKPSNRPEILGLQGAPVDTASLGDALTNLVALVGGGAPAESVKAVLVGVAHDI